MLLGLFCSFRRGRRRGREGERTTGRVELRSDFRRAGYGANLTGVRVRADYAYFLPESYLSIAGEGRTMVNTEVLKVEMRYGLLIA